MTKEDKKREEGPGPEKLYRPEAVAKMLDMSPNTVRAWLRDGTLQGVKVAGKVWRVKQSELDRLLEANGKK